MKHRLIFIMSMVVFTTAAPARNPLRAFYIGHSLSDQIPDMVKSLADDHPIVEFDWVYQSIPGAPLRWQWDRKAAEDYNDIPPHHYGFYDQQFGLPSATFTTLVLTESVPRYGNLIQETYQYADSFFVYAARFNPDIQVYLYEDWHCLLSGTPTGCDYDIDSNPWRQRIDDDLPMWESVVDTLNARYQPARPVRLIPAAQGLACVHDSIAAGVMPGLSSIEDIFSDAIHLTDVGKYFVACVHFATLFGVSPEGLTNQTQVWWGGDFTAPPPELAAKFQQIAWQVVTGYASSEIGSSVNRRRISKQDDNISVYPNPANDYLVINLAGDSAYSIFNVFGKLVHTGRERRINVKQLPPGVYLLKSKQRAVKFTLLR